MTVCWDSIPVLEILEPGYNKRAKRKVASIHGQWQAAKDMDTFAGKGERGKNKRIAILTSQGNIPGTHSLPVAG